MITVKKYKPVSPGLRGLISIKNLSLYKGRSYKKLTCAKNVSSGRNNSGKITIWGRGGGHKKNYRKIDWKRDKHNIIGKIERIEYDPNRTSYIMLILYIDGERRYNLYTKGLKVGDKIISGNNIPINIGNNLLIKNIPLGLFVHSIELIPGMGAKFTRSAGNSAQILAKDEKYASIRLKSGEIRKILLNCYATIGEVGKSEHNLQKLGKAGRSRWMNKRPRVRGVAMNPIDHPMGGGEGKSSGGRHPCSPWGLPDGKVTRKLNKNSLKFIVKSRKNK